jgi:hypothetical protein
MTEADLQRAVMDLCRWLGLLVFHSTDSRRDSCAGYPDLTICGQRGLILRELKSAKGTLRPEQRDWLSRLQQAGADADIWRPTDMASGRIKDELTALTTRRTA